MYLIFQIKIPLIKHLYVKKYNDGKVYVFLKFNRHFYYLTSNNYFENDVLKTIVKVCDKKTAVTYVSIIFPCRGSKWNPQVDFLLV